MAEDKTDYSPFTEEAGGEAAKRRKHRMLWGVLGASHMLLVYALVLAGIVLLVIYLVGGFGEGAE